MSHSRKAMNDLASGAGDALGTLATAGTALVPAAIGLFAIAAVLGLAWRVFKVAAGM